MKKNIPQKILQIVRTLTPLFLRQKIGPHIALLHYKYRNLTKARKPHVLTIMETLERTQKEKLSIIRFGDGEITLLDNHDLSFQKKNLKLAQQLEKIVKVKEDGLLICIPGIWDDLDTFEPYAKSFIIHHLYRQNYIWNKVLSYSTTYGDAYITRHYLGSKNKKNSEQIFKKFFSLWDDTDIVLIEGSKSRVGVGNDIFSNTKSIQRILCPAENAYESYNKIKEAALLVPKNKLILIALGPTAKVLAYDLFQVGYRVLDIGHIDMEYDMFIRKENKQVKVKYKYFNEINERNPEDCTDSKYLEQIMVTIL